jgi:hypothetical protein
MALPSSPFPSGAGSAQVWSQLDAALRQQAISVVAQMAFNGVTMPSKPSHQASDHDSSPQLDEAPQ